MSDSVCFLCGDIIRRQLGFNPDGLNSQNIEVLKSMRKAWSNSLCILLDLPEGNCRNMVENVPYCLACHALICDVEFMVSTIARLEGRLRKVKTEVKTLMRQGYKKDSPYRQHLEQILFQVPVSGVADIDTEANLDLSDFAEQNEWTLSCSTNEEYECDSPSSTPDRPASNENNTNMKPSTKISSTCRGSVTKKTPNPKAADFSCNVCQKVMFGKNELKLHMKQSHSSKKLHKCGVCGKQYSTEEEVRAHEILHQSKAVSGPNPFPCVLCTTQCTSIYDLEKHVLTVHETGTFKCDLCSAIRVTEEKLRGHKKRAHLDGVTKMYKCPHCPFQGLFPSIVKAHERKHGEKVFQCDIGGCSKQYHYKNLLTIHQEKIHGASGRQKYACTLCPRIFVRKLLLMEHQRHHSTLRPYMCEVCSHTFKSDANLRNHRKTHAEGKRSGNNVKLRYPRRARLSTSFVVRNVGS